MQAKFDSFNRFEKPTFMLCKPGAEYDDGVVNNVVGFLAHTSDEELVANFNEVSEFNFVLHKVDDSLDPHNLYEHAKNHQYVYIDNLGFFCFTQVDETIEKNGSYKSIRAQSAEVELQNKTMPGDFYQESEVDYEYRVTYEFDELLSMLLDAVPMWEKGEIDNGLNGMYRTFEDISEDTNILSFMLEEMQDAYECIFVFDIINRRVNVYNQNNYLHKTSIHLSNDDIVNSIQVTSSADDIYTALSVTGEDDRPISRVNPLGTNTIYRYDYYLNVMTETLAEKVQDWEDLIKANEDDYYELAKDYAETEEDVLNAQLELTRLNSDKELYQSCRNNVVAASGITDSTVAGFAVYGDQADTIITNAQAYTGSMVTPLSVSPKHSEALTVTSNAVTLHNTPSGTVGNEIAGLYVKDEDGVFVRRLFQSSTLAIGYFVYDAITKTISFAPGDLTNGTNIAVFYDTDDSGAELDAVIVTEVLDEIDSRLTQVNLDIATAEQALLAYETSLEDIDQDMQDIRDAVSMESTFSTDELNELSLYTFEGRYSDDYLVITDIMTAEERIEQIHDMYVRANTQLLKVSQPTEEFTVDTENFIFQKRFEPWTDQLETGVLIAVELHEDDVADLFLSNFTVNYEDESLSMTFGNRYNTFDTKSLFEDLLGNIQRTSNSLAFIKENIYPLRAGEFDAMQHELENIRTLSATHALASQNQDFIIDSTGITGIQLDQNGDPLPRQIKIVNNMLAMTDDNWETCSIAIGELQLGGTSVYGVNAKVLAGDIVLGSQLGITNNSGNLMFNDDGFVITNGINTFTVNPNDATKLISLSRGVNDLLYADGNGTLHIADSVIIGGSGSSSTVGKVVTSVTTKNQYCMHDSSTTPPGSSATWSNDSSGWTTGKYIWVRVATTRSFADGSTPAVDYSTAIYDAALTTAIANSSTPVVALDSAVSCYYRANVTPVSQISDMTDTDKSYLYQGDLYRYSNGSWQNLGDFITYITPTSSTHIDDSHTNTDDEWGYIMPEPSRGKQYYTCERYVKTDNSVAFSDVREMSNLTYTSLWCSVNDRTQIDGGIISTNSINASSINVGSFVNIGDVLYDHINLSPNGVAIKHNTDTLALFGSDVTIGRLDKSHQIYADASITYIDEYQYQAGKIICGGTSIGSITKKFHLKGNNTSTTVVLDMQGSELEIVHVEETECFWSPAQPGVQIRYYLSFSGASLWNTIPWADGSYTANIVSLEDPSLIYGTITFTINTADNELSYVPHISNSSVAIGAASYFNIQYTSTVPANPQFAFGRGAVSSGGKFVIGSYNDNTDPNQVFVVGIGGPKIYGDYNWDPTPANGFSVDSNGNIHVRRSIYADCMSDSSGGEIVPSSVHVLGSGNFSYEEDFEEYAITGTNAPTACKYGHVVTLAGAFATLTPVSQPALGTGTIHIGSVPDGCEPREVVRFVQQGSGMNRFLLTISTDGQMYIDRYGSGSSALSQIPEGAWLNISCTYLSSSSY